MFRTRVVGSVLAAGALATLSSCGSPTTVVSSKATGGPQVAATATIAPSSFNGDLSFLEPYGDEGDELLHAAVESRIGKCMESKGFSYPSRPFAPLVRGGAAGINGMTRPDPDQASRFGFGRGQQAPVPAEVQVAIDAQAQLSSNVKGWQEAISRSGTGCRHSAWASVGAVVPQRSRESFSKISGAVSDEFERLAPNDSAIAAAQKDWNSCVVAKGSSPEKIKKLIDARAPGAVTQETSVGARLAAECNLSSGLYDAYEALSRKIAVVWVTTHPVEIADLRATVEREIALIRSL
jgi:hypothetical protein